MSSIIKVNTFQDANGNALFNSDGSGNVTLSSADFKNEGAFSAYNNTATSLSASTFTKFPTLTEDFDNDSWFDTSTSRYTPQSAGKYCFFIGVQFSCTANSMKDVRVAIYKNGSSFGNIIFRDNGTPMASDIISNKVSFIMSMNGSTDYVEPYGYINFSSGTASFDNGRGRCYFNGYKIIGA